ncbi:hypothetical protein N7510_010327 [Penicillium lagena]|uniref:uncharacterized protein n=1 Tax=Penicillium lagena TaxID=94218 RepID=UPI0025402598|nr:uncharacterized protein N7510_010327 [Penicillium lagena]KAJ5605173.1 hypothetical protein N7510_010327 [Penicillium lagena]
MTWIHNFHGHDPGDETVLIIAIDCVFPIIALLAVFLRFYARRFTNRSPWVDDYAALSSAILILGRAGLIIALTRWGVGLDDAYFPPENMIPFGKIQYATGPFYTLALLGFKIALLTSYLRMGGFVKTYRIIIIIVLVAVTINQVLFTLLVCVSCIPVAKQWNPSIPGHCIDTLALYYSIAATSIAFDLIIIALPLPVLWGLSLQRKQKLMLTCIFALGFFITIIQVIRILSVSNLSNSLNSRTTIIWSTIEICLGTVICCIPTYGPLVRAVASTLQKHVQMSSYQLNSRRRAKLARDYPETRLNTIHGSNETRNTTTISATSPEDLEDLGDDECDQHASSWMYAGHIHTTTQFSVEKTLV